MNMYPHLLHRLPEDDSTHKERRLLFVLRPLRPSSPSAGPSGDREEILKRDKRLNQILDAFETHAESKDKAQQMMESLKKLFETEDKNHENYRNAIIASMAAHIADINSSLPAGEKIDIEEVESLLPLTYDDMAQLLVSRRIIPISKAAIVDSARSRKRGAGSSGGLSLRERLRGRAGKERPGKREEILKNMEQNELSRETLRAKLNVLLREPMRRRDQVQIDQIHENMRALMRQYRDYVADFEEETGDSYAKYREREARKNRKGKGRRKGPVRDASGFTGVERAAQMPLRPAESGRRYSSDIESQVMEHGQQLAMRYGMTGYSLEKSKEEYRRALRNSRDLGLPPPTTLDWPLNRPPQSITYLSPEQDYWARRSGLVERGLMPEYRVRGERIDIDEQGQPHSRDSIIEAIGLPYDYDNYFSYPIVKDAQHIHDELIRSWRKRSPSRRHDLFLILRSYREEMERRMAMHPYADVRNKDPEWDPNNSLHSEIIRVDLRHGMADAGTTRVDIQMPPHAVWGPNPPYYKFEHAVYYPQTTNFLTAQDASNVAMAGIWFERVMAGGRQSAVKVHFTKPGTYIVNGREITVRPKEAGGGAERSVGKDIPRTKPEFHVDMSEKPEAKTGEIWCGPGLAWTADFAELYPGIKNIEAHTITVERWGGRQYSQRLYNGTLQLGERVERGHEVLIYRAPGKTWGSMFEGQRYDFCFGKNGDYKVTVWPADAGGPPAERIIHVRPGGPEKDLIEEPEEPEEIERPVEPEPPEDTEDTVASASPSDAVHTTDSDSTELPYDPGYTTDPEKPAGTTPPAGADRPVDTTTPASLDTPAGTTSPADPTSLARTEDFIPPGEPERPAGTTPFSHFEEFVPPAGPPTPEDPALAADAARPEGAASSAAETPSGTASLGNPELLAQVERARPAIKLLDEDVNDVTKVAQSIARSSSAAPARLAQLVALRSNRIETGLSKVAQLREALHSDAIQMLNDEISDIEKQYAQVGKLVDEVIASLRKEISPETVVRPMEEMADGKAVVSEGDLVARYSVELDVSKLEVTVNMELEGDSADAETQRIFEEKRTKFEKALEHLKTAKEYLMKPEEILRIAREARDMSGGHKFFGEFALQTMLSLGIKYASEPTKKAAMQWTQELCSTVPERASLYQHYVAKTLLGNPQLQSDPEKYKPDITRALPLAKESSEAMQRYFDAFMNAGDATPEQVKAFRTRTLEYRYTYALALYFSGDKKQAREVMNDIVLNEAKTNDVDVSVEWKALRDKLVTPT